VPTHVFYETATSPGVGTIRNRPADPDHESLNRYNMAADDDGRPLLSAQPTNFSVRLWSLDGKRLVEWETLGSTRKEIVSVWREDDSPEEDPPLRSQTIEIDLPRPDAAAPDEILTPVESPELDRLIQHEVKAEVGLIPGTAPKRPIVRIDFSALEPYLLEHEGPTIGMAVDLLCDGEVRFRTRGWIWTTERDSADPESRYVLTNLYIVITRDVPTQPPMRTLDFTSGNWSVRLKSDEFAALQNFNCTKYWVGEVTLPLEIPNEIRDENWRERNQ